MLARARNAGAITAALFLKQYVKEGVEWAHLDVAGGHGRGCRRGVPLKRCLIVVTLPRRWTSTLSCLRSTRTA